MFSTEQTSRQNLKNCAGNLLSSSGMALVNGDHVKKHFSYKELTMILGVIIAAVIILAVWLSRDNIDAAATSTLSSPDTSLPDLLEAGEKIMGEVMP